MAVITIPAGTASAVNISAVRSDILSSSKQGDALRLQLRNGDELVINDFFTAAADGGVRTLAFGDGTLSGPVRIIGTTTTNSGAGLELTDEQLAAAGVGVAGLGAALIGGGSDSDSSTEPTNTDPRTINDNASAISGQASAINVLANDTDEDGDPLVIENVSNPVNGTAMVSRTSDGDQVVDYQSNAGFTGTDTFEYTVSDGNGGTSTSTVTVDVAPAPDTNTPPQATDDFARAIEGQARLIDVLANDTDPDGDPLTITSVGQAENGTAVIVTDANGKQVAQYTSDEGFTGTDTFTYTVSDGNGGTVTRTVTVNVEGEPNTNTDPEAAPDDATAIGTQATLINVLANDMDPNGDTLTISSVGQADNGTAVIVTDSDGNQTIQYTADEGFTGTDTFEYTISDGNGGTATSTVTMTVEQAPVIGMPPEANPDAATAIGTQATLINVLANDTDPDGDTLTISSIGGAQNGTPVIVTDEDGNQTIQYTADADFTGTDTFEYTVSDGNGGTATSTVTMTVEQAPGINTDPDANADAAMAIEGQSTLIDVLANDTDADGDDLTISSVGQANNGTAAIVTDANGNQVAQYTANEGFTGTDSFQYTISDGNGGTATNTVTMTVGPDTGTNTDPDANADAATATGTQATLIDVLANDTDADGDTLTISSVGQADNGTAVIVTDANGNQVAQYTANEGFTGTDSFQYTISDGNGGTSTNTVTMTVEQGPIDGILDPLIGDNGLLGDVTGNAGLLGDVTGSDGLLGNLTDNEGLLGDVTGSDGLVGDLTNGSGLLGDVIDAGSQSSDLLGGVLGNEDGTGPLDSVLGNDLLGGVLDGTDLIGGVLGDTDLIGGVLDGTDPLGGVLGNDLLGGVLGNEDGTSPLDSVLGNDLLGGVLGNEDGTGPLDSVLGNDLLGGGSDGGNGVLDDTLGTVLNEGGLLDGLIQDEALI